jgi:fatty acid desaturase
MNDAKEDLQIIRNLALQIPEVALFVRSSRKMISSRELWFSSLCLIVNIIGQIVWGANFMFPAILFMIIGLVGIAGMSSLSHESWHNRLLPDKGWSRRIAVWWVSPLLLRGLDGAQSDHAGHHKFMGANGDPDSHVWRMTKREHLIGQAWRLLIVPAVLGAGHRLLRGGRGGVSSTIIARQNATKLNLSDLTRVGVVHLCWALPLILTSWQAWVFGHAGVMLIGAVLANVREYGEHEYYSDGRLVVYDTCCTLPSRLLIAGGSFHLHGLHHLFPEVPQAALKSLHRLILTGWIHEVDFYKVSPQVRRQKSYFERLFPNE